MVLVFGGPYYDEEYCGTVLLVSGGPYYDGEWPWGRLAAALGATPDLRTLSSLYHFHFATLILKHIYVDIYVLVSLN